MPTVTPHIPKYRHYRPKGLAVVRVDGKDIYLGKFDTPESRERCRRVLAGCLPRGAPPPLPRPSHPDGGGPAALSVNEVILAFWSRHAEAHYRRADGTPTGELANFRDALR